MDTAKANGLLIIFDRSTKKFYENFKEIDIKNKIIFPRSFLPYEEELLIQISNHGGFSIQTKEERDKIINWPQLIQPIYRKVIPTTYKEFQENVENYKSIFNTLFFKTAIKSNTHCILDFYGYINIDNSRFFVTKPPLWNVSLNDKVFLSEAFLPIEDIENKMDCKEYRIFVLNNSLLSISRSYIDYPTIIDNDVIKFAEEQIIRASFIKDFPTSYVLDIGKMKINNKEVIDIIEYNPISSSGLEVSNLLIEQLLNKKQSSIKLTKHK